MKPISRIEVTSKKNIGHQIIKDSVTSTEKKILVHMLNTGMTDGSVRNKTFHIKQTDTQNAEVIIRTTEKSIVLGRNETIQRKFTIKFS